MSDLDLLRRLGDQIVPPPLDELRETVRRRNRRTATITSVAAAAAVAGVVVGVHAASSRPHSAPPVQLPESHTRPVTYAEGATLHYGSRTVTMPSPVAEIDLTDEGAVARTEDGRIWFTAGGEPAPIGTLGTPGDQSPDFGKGPGAIVGFGSPSYVVSGNIGPLVAWWEFQPQGPPQLVAYDTSDAEEALRQTVTLPEAGSTVLLDSVSDRFVYWYVDAVRTELDTPDARMDLATGEQSGVTDKQYANDAPPPGTARTVLVSHAEGGGAPYTVTQGLLQLGPTPNGGRLVVLGEQPLEALDGATRVPFSFRPPTAFEPPGTPAFLIQWVDDDTVVIAFKLDGPADLLTCRISTRSCEVAARSLDAVLPEIG